MKVQNIYTTPDCKVNGAQILLFKETGTLSACCQGQKSSPLAPALLQSHPGGKEDRMVRIHKAMKLASLGWVSIQMLC